ncbi:MAG TPA: histidine kinase dimerization/phospho-acceptor domain-containing protein [Chloroflexota bacterium]|jgi:signal transduction histidine kinase|nr:histidine kinase dimerization/phospho-acceptor domain-containing protein [Chloroflexota bacterium]
MASSSGSSLNSEHVELDTDDALATFCHRLRTPLTAAMGFLQLALRDAHRAGAEASHLEMADEQLRRMAGMIDQLAVDVRGPAH